jgi:hypothetical protein
MEDRSRTRNSRPWIRTGAYQQNGALEGVADMQHDRVNATSMRWRCALGAIATAATLMTCYLGPSPARAQAHPSSTPGDGRIWYEKYCTPCHGPGGAPGSAVFAKSKQPVDLRTYVQRHGGKFPSGDWLTVVMAEPPHWRARRMCAVRLHRRRVPSWSRRAGRAPPPTPEQSAALDCELLAAPLIRRARSSIRGPST